MTGFVREGRVLADPEWRRRMTVRITVTLGIVGDGEYEVAYETPHTEPKGQQLSTDQQPEAQRMDRVLPAGSSTLAPGLSMPVA